MKIHLITIEIGIICAAIGIVHPDRLLFWKDSCDVSHYTRLVKCRLSVDHEYIARMHVPVYYLSTDRELVGYPSALLSIQDFQVDLLSSLFIFNNICTRMLLRTVNDSFSQSFYIEI